MRKNHHDPNVYSDEDSRWLVLDDEDSVPVLDRNKENSPASAKRAGQGKDFNESPSKKNAVTALARRRIGLSFNQTVQLRSSATASKVYEFNSDDVYDNDPEVPTSGESNNLILDNERDNSSEVAPVNANASVDEAQAGRDIVADQAGFVPQAPEQNANVNSYLYNYPERDLECPDFLNEFIHRQHKDIFEQLSRQGQRFLCTNQQGNRWWGLYPTHVKTFFQPMSNPLHQIYFPASPKDIVYHGTWVSAIDKEAAGRIYPVHIITKNTLGAVKNLLAYPSRIQKIFADEEFAMHWPHGLEKECVIVIVDKPEQQQHVFRDYEGLVNTEGRNALKTVPDLRVYCKGVLSELKTVADCRQRNLLNMLKPNLLPYAERKQVLLQLEKTEIDLLEGDLSREDFEGVCGQFFSPAPLSHELALTHFSLTQLRSFYGILTQSRKRMIELKGRLVSHYKGPQMEDPDLRQFLLELDQSIRTRTATIQKLFELDRQYVEYSRRLSYLFQLAPDLSMEQIETQIYGRVQDRINRQAEEGVNFEAQFSSGKALIAWLITREIEVPLINQQTLTNAIVEQMPRANVQRQIIAF